MLRPWSPAPRSGAASGESSSPFVVKQTVSIPERLRRPLHQLDDVPPNQWLPSREPDLPHPELTGDPDHPEDLIRAQQLLPLREVDPFFRHAVDAAEIAPIGNGDPQVIENPPEPIPNGVRADIRRRFRMPPPPPQRLQGRVRERGPGLPPAARNR